MKKFLLHSLCFSLPILFVYTIITLFILPKLIEKTRGPATETQIRNSFLNAKNSNYDLLVLGNSRTYRGINPDVFTIPSYNFSHDADSFNQIYHKLIWLKNNGKKFKYLLLGVDYFQFNSLSDTRNYIYSVFLGSEYLKDFPNSNLVNLFFSRTNILDFSRMKYLQNAFRKEQNSTFQRKNGQYITPVKATKNDKHDFISIKRLPIQEQYFDMIFDYCTKQDIEIFLCILPARENFLKRYQESEIQEFNKFIFAHINNKIHFLDYSHQSGWNLEDYQDLIHLNEMGANKFSKQLNDTLIKFVNHKTLLSIGQKQK